MISLISVGRSSYGTVVLTIIGIILISGCVQEPKKETVTCNSPYIKVGTSCCLDQNSNNVCDNEDKKDFDYNKIIISGENSYNLELFFAQREGPAMVEKLIGVTNNNDVPITIRAGFLSPSSWTWHESVGSYYNLFCFSENVDMNIEAHGSSTVSLRCANGVGSSGVQGTLIQPTPNIKVNTKVQISIEKVGSEKMSKVIKEIPFEVTLHCYEEGIDNCIKITE